MWYESPWPTITSQLANNRKKTTKQIFRVNWTSNRPKKKRLSRKLLLNRKKSSKNLCFAQKSSLSWSCNNFIHQQEFFSFSDNIFVIKRETQRDVPYMRKFLHDFYTRNYRTFWVDFLGETFIKKFHPKDLTLANKWSENFKNLASSPTSTYLLKNSIYSSSFH